MIEAPSDVEVPQMPDGADCDDYLPLKDVMLLLGVTPSQIWDHFRDGDVFIRECEGKYYVPKSNIVAIPRKDRVSHAQFELTQNGFPLRVVHWKERR